MEWISVKKKLPEIEQDVLVWDGFGHYVTCRLDCKKLTWDDVYQVFDDITHWIPLPEPPKPE